MIRPDKRDYNAYFELLKGVEYQNLAYSWGSLLLPQALLREDIYPVRTHLTSLGRFLNVFLHSALLFFVVRLTWLALSVVGVGFRQVVTGRKYCKPASRCIRDKD